ncbi:HDIG domain-containing metalloprotein [Prochlorococcus sp. MIT 1223]|uniref:HDIG domain-containing metalloprotein n=1 Tax=Prochlorococcus sp. MIT 1223 TaxID=3096217 RepID=UPI002A751296|nr:HDIG domain-containing metalloprotein [Prochlorococcus sp. MIT 1223]
MKRFRRHWLRSQSPRRSVLLWNPAEKVGLFLVCIFIAIISSYKLLAVPELRPGDLSPFDAIAPREDVITDSSALKKKRSELQALTFVKVIDKKETENLLSKLNNNLKNLQLLIENNEVERSEIKLKAKERYWLYNQYKENKEKWQKEIIFVSKNMLSQGLVKNLAIDQLKDSAALQLSLFNPVNSTSNSIGSKLIAKTFEGKTNLKHDPTRSQKLFEEQISKQGIPKHPLIKKGDLIIQKGDVINQKDFDFLAHFGLIKITPRPTEWFYKFTEALASCGVLILIMRREKPRLKTRQALLSLGLISIVQVSKIWFGAAISPLAIIVPPTLLLSQGIGTASALAWMSIACFIWPAPVTGIEEGRLIIAAISAALVAFLGRRMRSRAELLQIAILLPCLALGGEWFFLRSQFSYIKINSVNLSSGAESLISEAFVVGAIIMFTILLLPIIENTFGLLTSARLMELADQERPLLRRLSKEAPGTFEHTLMICGLAEEGARSIGADIDLIRTGALYHDVGKLHAPEWFIENQEDGVNPHDAIKDPFKSADILQAHVDEGLKLARRYRLPGAIADFIPEHQGTLKMGYFLHQARQKDPSTSEKRFRYRGPNPQSKETAILMLADGCEAALRSLEAKTTDNEACDTVRKIIKSRQTDGQLLESSLTRSEMELVIQGFVRVWRRMRHRRLKYPVSTQKKLIN